jgi:polysaccharide deacetylase 2 family uncharacterized protein YibQ
LRGFLTGVAWGGVVTALGLAVVSELTLTEGAGPAVASSDVAPASAEATDQEPVATPVVPAVPQPAQTAEVATPAEPTASADVEVPDETAGDAQPDPLMNPSKAKSGLAAATPSEPEIKAVGDVPKEPAPLPDADELASDDPVEPATDTASQPPAVKSAPTPSPPSPDPTAPLAQVSDAADPSSSDVAPAQLTPPVADGLPVADAGAPPAAPVVKKPAAEPGAPGAVDPLPAQIAAVDPEPDAARTAPSPPAPTPMPAADPAPQSEDAPEPAPLADPAKPAQERPNNFTLDDKPSTLPPSSGFKRAVPGVVSNRLPRIGALPPVQSDPAVVADEADEDLSPLARFAATFENPDQKPVIAIVLLDNGLSEANRNLVNTLPFPVSIALDPTDPETPSAAATYRAAGREVVMLATTIPVGAEASDVAVTFQSHADAMPEAVAVLDLEEGGFQSNRPLATLVVPVIKDQGRAVITWDKGMNAGDQVARREGVASGMVFRRVDPEGSDPAAMRRLLDRAVFKANQSGHAIVVGEANNETIAVLVRWAMEGSGSGLAIGPVTAALTMPQ